MLVSADPKPTLTTPWRWPWALQSPPVASSEQCGWGNGLLRRWAGTSPVMVQPPLDHHYVVIHLGGAKRVTRKRDGPHVSGVVEENALTLVPAGTRYLWNTQGPIAFAHLYLEPGHLHALAASNDGCLGRSASLVDKVGCRDAFLEPLLLAMVREIEAGPCASKLRLDSLHEAACSQIVYRHSSGLVTRSPKAVALASFRLRRVLDFIEAHLQEDLSLQALAAAAGTSQAHFSRTFQIATGCSPYRYLIRRRIEYAKVLLMTSQQPLDAISAACGFVRSAQFAKMFKAVAGLGPKRYMTAHRPRKPPLPR